MKCTIVPPHILERVAERGSDAGLRDLARHCLDLDAGWRTERRSAPVVTAAREPSTNPDRTVYDAQQREELPGQVARAEDAPPVGDEAVDQNFEWLGVAFDFFRTVYDRNSIDGSGLPLLSTVHYGRDYDNAFWNGKQLVYGDGDGRLFTSFTGPLDVTGHELTHGVTQYAADLAYYGQSGALNEHVSDVFGALVKQYHLGHAADEADWLIGEGLLGPEVNGKALRSMREPGTAYDDPELGKDPQPGHMDDYDDTSRDNGGVHINSGIPNRAFYLAATAIGGNAWDKAGRVWYAALTGGRLSRTSDFAEFSAAVARSAGDLYGTDGDEARAVRDAWQEVGMQT